MKLPGGKNLRPSYGGEYQWTKNGGYYDKGDISKAAQANGFKLADSKATNSPDGSHMGGGTRYEHPDGTVLRMSSSYGVTKSDNYHSINLSNKK